MQQARRSWGEPVARSLLTPSGAPIEVSLRGAAASPTWTVEPGPPDAAPADKWRHVLAIAPEVAAWDLPLAADLRAAVGQRFGCWLGLRDGGGKVYQEVAPGAQALVLREMARDTGVDTTMLVPTLVGFAERQREYYGHWPRVDRGGLHRLLAALGLAAGLPLLLDCLGWLGGASADRLLETVRTGISLKHGADGQVHPALFWHAIDLLPRDIAAERIATAAKQLGADFAVLDTIKANGVPVSYGMLGLSLDRDCRVALSLGIAPNQATQRTMCDDSQIASSKNRP